jgi:VWFA-related protein
MGRTILVLLLTVAGAWQSGSGQRFRSETATVYIYATVQGRDGRLVPNLQQADFTVFDNGRPQPITVFDNAPQRITLALMFDMSTSMDKVHGRLRTAAAAFVDALWPQDRVRIGSFSDEVALSPWLTDDKAILRRIVDEELWPGGGTPLWYALDAAMASLDKEPGRRVVLTFTDGKNAGVPVGPIVTFSSLDAVSKHADRGGYMIYAIGLQDAGLTRELIDLARETGGGHFVVGKRDDLGASFTRVVDELHHQYMIGFVQPEADGQNHDVRVSTRTGAEVRARTSYVAERARSGS